MRLDAPRKPDFFPLSNGSKILPKLLKLTMSWNKGLTKETSLSVMKISRTMRKRKIDNFLVWRNRMKVLGKIPGGYAELIKCEELAEFVGVILGDGNISKFPRTERLIISAHSTNRGFVNRYVGITRRVLGKEPTVTNVRGANCTRISVYEKYLSKRLEIPAGSRQYKLIRFPGWIRRSDKFVQACLRGLYEAEGSFSYHPATYTHKAHFSNTNPSLLNFVYMALKRFGFHPLREHKRITLSRRDEVAELQHLLNFRKY